MKVYSENRGTVLLILNPAARYRRVVNVMPRPFYPAKRNAVPIEQEAGWAP